MHIRQLYEVTGIKGDREKEDPIELELKPAKGQASPICQRVVMTVLPGTLRDLKEGKRVWLKLTNT